jgi:hypothetical protein
VRDLGPEDTLPEPHLTLRVNGVKIAARGGSWGMDDALKRHDRARLEPYFRLHKDAHLNIIRNWMGNNTEPEFYDLADEYGMMVLNDFWQSTQNFQVEPEDPALFLANAEDVVKRYRNHPSIVVWFGRNEGVPYPTLNEGLDDLLFRLDGTRWYTGSSNTVNLQGSGPYNYRQPEGYFTDLATGFSVETGTPSLATREAVSAYVPPADRWPLSDTLAYHDWHFSGNGDTKTFMQSLERRFGPATSFEDFERKAQMMNLEGHKAMFEGFLGHLWTRNSGRLLWMTHPAWTSNAWQIYSSDYDTHAAYYGIAKAAEPLHVQINLPGNEVVVINTTRDNAPGLTATTRILGLDGKELFARRDRLDALANRDTMLPAVPLGALLAQHPMVLVSQSLTDRSGHVLSSNLYWRGKDESSYRALNDLPPVALKADVAAPVTIGQEQELRVTLTNPGSTPALAAKLTLLDAQGQRILPAYYSDNYLSARRADAGGHHPLSRPQRPRPACQPARLERDGRRGRPVMTYAKALLAATMLWAGAAQAAPPTAAVTGGTIAGTMDDHGTLLFRAIPFAAPPLGDLRWRPPAPVVPWQGQRDAARPGPSCLQNDYGWNHVDYVRASEDCLTLDVATPALDGKRPVMVWIHGGSNRAGSAGETVRASLVRRGVVLVAVQYRLGLLGNLPHRALAAEQGGHTGNYGLMDQIAALRWVQANIARFGGDPANVTIFGESAGAQDVGLLLAAPETKGLFARAILESGTPSFGLSWRPLDQALRLGDQLDAVLGTGGGIAPCAPHRPTPCWRPTRRCMIRPCSMTISSGCAPPSMAPSCPAIPALCCRRRPHARSSSDRTALNSACPVAPPSRCRCGRCLWRPDRQGPRLLPPRRARSRRGPKAGRPRPAYRDGHSVPLPRRKVVRPAVRGGMAGLAL